MVLKEKITVASYYQNRLQILHLSLTTVYTTKNIFKKNHLFLGMVICRSALVLPCNLGMEFSNGNMSAQKKFQFKAQN